MFSEGLMHGQGTYMWADGVKYEGDFSVNVPMGHGVYTWPDRSSYQGEVYEGLRHGTGTYRCGNKSASYTGQWHQGYRHGKGIMYYNQEGTSWYEGDWICNVREGWGVRCFSSGNLYVGQWKNGARHGEGRMQWLSYRQQYNGQWENGIQHGQGTHTWFLKRVPGSQYPLRNEYVGAFVQGLRHGHGKFYYASGALYDGEWQCNKKHGQGKFIFKNGRIFEGEFVEDHMAEFPGFSLDGTHSPDLSGIRTHTPPCGDDETSIRSQAPGSLVLGPDMALDICSLLERLPEASRDTELKQVEFAVLRHITELRQVYSFYSSLGYEHSPDNTFLLTRLQFWRLLKDCQIHQHHLTLAHVDRLCSEGVPPDEIHSPFDTMLLRTFLSNMIVLAYDIYHEQIESSNHILASCFYKLVRENIIPNARDVKGTFFSHHLHAVIAVNYIEKSWEIYRAYCLQNTRAPYEPSMKMRHFIQMLKDLNLYGEELTVGKALHKLAAENPAAYDGTHSNLELEMTFLEFFEALLGCAEVCGTGPGPSEIPADVWKAEDVPRDSPVEEQRGSPSQHTLQPSAQAVLTQSAQKEDLATRNRQTFKSSHLISASLSSTGKKSETRKSKELMQSSASEDLKQSVESEANLKEQSGHQSGNGARSGSALQSARSQSVEGVHSVSDLSVRMLHSKPALAPACVSPGSDRAEGLDERESELDRWIQQVHVFFTKRFFPAYEYSLLVKKEVAEERERRVVRARTARARAAEAARLKKLWEAAEEKQREEQEEQEGERVEAQEEDPYPLRSPVLTVSTSAVRITKPPPSSGKKKKK
ncbi:R10B1 protein, partial [Amia calva]|nr:R10B1 protein [Amia calva]